MKKIKITEGQAKRLKLITENIDPLTEFEQLCKQKAEEVNKLYTHVTGFSIIEILTNQIDMAEISNRLDRIENEVSLGDRKAYAYINGLSEEDLDVRIDRAHDLVTDKLTPLQIITMDLEKLQLTSEEHNLTKAFGDIKSLDITGLQNS
jgi:hypothetical protein